MIAALAASLALLSQPSDAADGREAPKGPGVDARSVSLERVFPFWTDYLDMAADERSAFTLDYVITERGGTAGFWVETADGFQRLERDADGAATPPDAAAFDSGARLFTDAPEGGASVSMRLSLSVEPSTEYAVETLETALAQAANAMRNLMGLRAIIMPRLDTIRFSFDGPAPSAMIVYADGEERAIETVYGDVVSVRPRDRVMRQAVAIRFGTPPRAAVLQTGH